MWYPGDNPVSQKLAWLVRSAISPDTRRINHVTQVHSPLWYADSIMRGGVQMSQRHRSIWAVIVLLSAVAITFTITGASATRSKHDTVQSTSPQLARTTQAASPNLPKADGALAQSIRKGTYPTQLAGYSGAMKPNLHGPFRTDPTAGKPAHAYSPFDEKRNREHPCPNGGCEFAGDRILVKLAGSAKPVNETERASGALTRNSTLNPKLVSHGIQELQPVFPKARAPKAGETVMTRQGQSIPKPDLTKWYRAKFSGKGDIHAAVETLKNQPGVEAVEPDYLRRPVGSPAKMRNAPPAGTISNLPGPSGDPLYDLQWHLEAANVPAAWQWLESQGLQPGGNRDIIVAVIDTGVDYNHPDLAANMWVNSLEIAGNGVDDDGDGFIDDVHGVSVVSNSFSHSGNPMDDHGHGTHVAGIIAASAENNLGGVGVAYNVQIMAIKAAQYSGALSTSDIAEGIYYAVEHGADVINMSFGGYARSQVEEDALAVAFGQAVLVAAAGNDGALNLPCLGGRDMYPAAYSWVLGVMASSPGGGLTLFSNKDCISHDSHEYELRAPGVEIWGTLPGEQYAAWSGTSMAAPIVSGIAALLRTRWTDKDSYSSRFIMGQIAANASPVADTLASLTVYPRPELRYLEHWLFDTSNQSATNDDDGIVDAGETIDLAIVIRNHWGKADPVSVKLEAKADGAVQTDPYVTMITDTVDYGAVGSFSQDDNGLVYDSQGLITGVQNPFRFSISQDCPNDHVIPFLLTMTAHNGLDLEDTNSYTFQSRFNLIVQRGRELPRIISEDMTLSKEYFWLVPGTIRLNQGVTLTITEGTQVQWGSANPSDPYQEPSRADILKFGSLQIEGTYEEPVELFRCQGCSNSPTVSITRNGDPSNIRYAKIDTPDIGSLDMYMDHCLIYSDIAPPNGVYSGIEVTSTTKSIINWWPGVALTPGTVDTCLFNARSSSWIFNTYNFKQLSNCTFLQNNAENFTWTLYFSWKGNLGEDYFATEAEAVAGTRHRNNAFLSKYWDPNVNHWMRFNCGGPDQVYGGLAHNFWGTTSTALINAAIVDFNDALSGGVLIYQPFLTVPAVTTYPHVVNVVLSTATNPDATIVGAEPVTFTVTFNRDMDQSVQPMVSFGPDVPMTDYTIHPVGDGWTNARTWIGTANITPMTGDGFQLIRVAGAHAVDDPWLVTGIDAARFRFQIITSGTESMNLQATGGEGYIDLMWSQNDFDLLAGFNLYRSTSEQGSYSRINSTIIPPGQRTLRNNNVQPGQPYFYKFTVVKSDMSESSPSNIATATPIDTIPPVISHTPLTSASPGMAISLFADATDNVGVKGVSLYYRAIGASSYSSRSMTNTSGNRYSATLEGAILTSPGIEYYITATDGISTVFAGRPEYPYQVGVVDKPVVTAVSPNRGPDSGETAVTLAGSNFKSGATVTFGGAPASSVSVVSPSQITCITPAHYAEISDVTVTNPDGQSGTLLRGYIFESTTASISMPNTAAALHAVIQLPVNANVQGLAAAELKVTFDQNVLSARSAGTGTLTAGWSMAANTNVAGEIRISMASPGGTIAGSGVLANIEFEVIGSPGTSSPLSLSAVSLNGGAIPVQSANGLFTVDSFYSVSGSVNYWNGGTGIPGVLLTATGDRAYTATTGADGAYTVNNLPRDDYSLNPLKSDDVKGLSAHDASLALQHAVGLTTLSGAQAVAADVDKSGAIGAMDALYMLQKAVGLISLPFPGAGVVWEFSPSARSYSQLSSNKTSQNFTAILLGDVNGNWASAESNSLSNVPRSLEKAAALTGDSNQAVTCLTLPSLSARTDTQKVMGLQLKNAVSLLSAEATIIYPADQLTLISVDKTDFSNGMTMAANTATPGQIRLAMAGAEGLTGTGDLISITFKLKGKPGQTAAVQLTGAQINDNSCECVTSGGITAVNANGALPAIMLLLQ